MTYSSKRRRKNSIVSQYCKSAVYLHFDNQLFVYISFFLILQFQEAEKKRYRAEQHRFEMKHQRQLEEARATSAAAIKELEQLQNEKRKMLMEHETQKLRELDEAYGQELRDWKAQLKPRKQVNWKKINIFLFTAIEICPCITCKKLVIYFFQSSTLSSDRKITNI